MTVSRRKLGGYCGRLSASQVAAGINAARSNAWRLAEDAETLLSAGRFPTAASLAILSIEEAGKISILRGIAIARSPAGLAEEWRRYRSHTAKNAAWILPQLVANGARTLSDLAQIFDESSNHPFLLDQVKQLGFYTDCLGRAHWSVPVEVIDEGLPKLLVRTAAILASRAECTEREVELWIEHMGPVNGRDKFVMERALINWFAALQQEGLVPSGPNAMEQFIFYGIGRSTKGGPLGGRGEF